MRSISGGTQPRLAPMARERELHEAIDELGHREPGRFPELGIEAAGREPGDRVDLAEVRFSSPAIDEKIGARHAEALELLEGAARPFADVGRRAGRERSRDAEV